MMASLILFVPIVAQIVFRYFGILPLPGIISFAPKIDFATGKHPYGLNITDIDGDGVVEVIVANKDDFSISIFKNNSSPGTISLGSKTDITNLDPSMLKAADLDNDGKPDLIATDEQFVFNCSAEKYQFCRKFFFCRLATITNWFWKSYLF